jgi:hypothetical protein
LIIGRAILLFLILSTRVYGTPEKITVFFLSEQQQQSLLHLLDHKEQTPDFNANLIATNPYRCIPMGDGCFDPQIGYYENKPPVLRPLPEDEVTPALQLRTFNSEAVQLVECREQEYFDIFCGQRKKTAVEGRSTSLELWFDVSASLRKNDYSRDMQHCGRRSFAQQIVDRCKKKPVIAVYNTSLKEVEQLSQICVTSGGNDLDRTLDWIRASRTKHLVIVTDTEEFTPPFRDFLARENSTIYGIDDGNLAVEKLLSHVKQISKSCQ